MSSFFKNIIVLAGLIFLAAVGYYLFVVERDATIVSVNGVEVDSAEVQTQLFLRRLEDLQDIQLPNTLFSDPRFRSLVDFATVVTPVPVGRPLPFQSADSRDSSEISP